MPFEYFEHEADVGIVGIGKTLEEAFEEAAKAMFNVEVDISRVECKEKVEVECSADNVEELFIEWLNSLLAEADMRNMVFSEFGITELSEHYLKGYACGEKLDAEKHKVKTEVKAATYSQLKIEEKDGLFYVKCVVDV
ncbi:archease [Candidatus Heimdallarchaeota archaeon]|nr:MAG: archease [Candidatus Heimdallarchaeota archaeon]